MPRQKLKRADTAQRREWKRLFRARTEQAEVKATELAQDMLYALSLLGERVPTDPAQADYQSYKRQLSAEINHWLSPKGSRVRETHPRVPQHATALVALLHALNWRKPFREDSLKRLHPELQPLLQLISAARFQWLHPPDDPRNLLLDRWLAHDVVVASMFRRDGYGDMDVVRVPNARSRFIEFLTDNNKRFLSVSLSRRNTDQTSPHLTPDTLPDVFRGYLHALCKAGAETGDPPSILAAAKRNLRFAALPWTEDFYGYCRPRLRVLIGLVAAHGLGKYWFMNLRSVCDLQQPKHFIALEQIDGIEAGAYGSTRLAAHEFLGEVLDSRDVVQWFLSMPQRLKDRIRFFRLDDGIESIDQLYERLMGRPDSLMLTQIGRANGGEP